MYFIRVSFFSVVWALLGLRKALVVDIDQEVLVEDCSHLVIVKVLKRCGPDPALWSFQHRAVVHDGSFCPGCTCFLRIVQD